MKKNYSNPKFKLVILDSNDLICTSESIGGFQGEQDNVELAKRRGSNIWGDDDE